MGVAKEKVVIPFQTLLISVAYVRTPKKRQLKVLQKHVNFLEKYFAKLSHSYL